MKLISVSTQEKQHIIYTKPDNCLIRNDEDFFIPEFSKHIAAQLALIIKIKKIGKNIGERFAPRYYDLVSTGINLTAYDVLEDIKQKGLPWDAAVAFDRSAPLGSFIPKEDHLHLEMELNGKCIATFNSESININSIISEASHLYTLKIGDLLYITPNSKSFKLEIGQEFSAKINGITRLKCAIK